MVKIKKKYVIIVPSVIGLLVIVYVISSIVSGLIIGGAFAPRIDEENMGEIFIDDYELLMTVVDYLVDSGHTSIWIRPDTDSDILLTRQGTVLSINDEHVVKTIEILRDLGYQSISKTENIIHFQRSSRGRDFGNGIAYSIDGVEPNFGIDTRDPLYGSTVMPAQIMYLTKLEPLPKQNWYYYEEDFNEWRSRQQTQVNNS